jgi:uncharacterized protein YjdB
MILLLFLQWVEIIASSGKAVRIMQNIIFEEKRFVKFLVAVVILVLAIGGLSPSIAAEQEDMDLKISSFGVTQKTIYVKKNSTIKLPFVAYANEGGEQLVKWKSDAKTVATVVKGKSNGEITLATNKTSKLTIHTGKIIGQGKITLSADNVIIVITVNVVKQTKPVIQKGLKIKGLIYAFDRHNLELGQTLKLKPVFTKKATVIATWKSSKPKVAKVDAAGRITGISPGLTTITLKVGAKTKKMSVRVLAEDTGVGSMP